MKIIEALQEMNHLEVEVCNRRKLLENTKEFNDLQGAEHKLWLFNKKNFGIAKGDMIGIASIIETIAKVTEMET